jgi:serine protease Do
MKNTSITLFAACVFTTAAALAQTAPKTEKKEIIIEKKEGTKKEKMEIVIDGEKVTINGKPAEEYKGEERIIINKDIIINGNSVVVPGPKGNMIIEGRASSRPLLGVMTEKDEKGVKINSVTKESGAAKAGLTEGDIITMINKTAVSTPEELTEAIKKQKPGDEIDVTFLREGKTRKLKATLGKADDSWSFDSDDFRFNFEGGRPYSFTMPRIPAMPREPFLNEDGMRRIIVEGKNRPRYGMQVQDDEDRKGAKITEVEDESNAAKAGLKENDIITEIDGQKILGVDDLKEKLVEKNESNQVNFTILRNGKSEKIIVKVPRKLKTASL